MLAHIFRAFVLLFLLDLSPSAKAELTSSIELADLIDIFMVKNGTHSSWAMGAGDEGIEIDWKTNGIKEGDCGKYPACRNAEVRISLAGKEIKNLRERLTPVTWLLFLGSTQPVKFSPPEFLRIMPHCDTVQCEFDFKSTLDHSGIQVIPLCKSKQLGVENSGFLLKRADKQVYAIYAENSGSGGLRNDITWLWRPLSKKCDAH